MITFDLDDTLYKETFYVASGLRCVGERIISQGLLPESLVRDILAQDADVPVKFDRLIRAVNDRTRLSIKDILETYRNHRPHIGLDVDTLLVLQQLHDRGITLGLITDGRQTGQQNKIEALGLERFIRRENILISEVTGFDKHSPEPFRIIAARNPGEKQYIYVGDNPEKDFYWPNRLGWQTIMLQDDGRNIHNQARLLESTTPDFHAALTINSLRELLALVRA